MQRDGEQLRVLDCHRGDVRERGVSACQAGDHVVKEGWGQDQEGERGKRGGEGRMRVRGTCAQMPWTAPTAAGSTRWST